MEIKAYVIAAVMALSAVCLTDAYSSGPPTSVCGTMMPSSGAAAQTSPPPYQLLVAPGAPFCYTPGQAMTGTVCRRRDQFVESGFGFNLKTVFRVCV
jgi:hypothetical protein